MFLIPKEASKENDGFLNSRDSNAAKITLNGKILDNTSDSVININRAILYQYHITEFLATKTMSYLTKICYND